MEAVDGMMHRGQVGRSEWRWVAVWIVVAAIVTSVPYVFGLARSSPERVFSGAAFAVEDMNSYFAKMREGASGEWLFHIVYTSEPHDGALFFLFHLLLGKFAALTGLPLEVTYHLARLVFGALLLLTLYRFIAVFSGSTAIRRVAFLLVAFGGGLGWVLMLAAQPNWLGSPPLDLILPEGFTFLVLYAMPHIALARTLLLLGLMLVWQPEAAWEGPDASTARRKALAICHAEPFDYARGKLGEASLPARARPFASLRVTTGGALLPWHIRRSVLAGVCWTAMALIVPFYVLVVYAAVFGAVVAASGRSIDWREVRRTVVACVIAAIMPIYALTVFTTNPVFAVWSSQNQITSPHPLHYLVAYGVVGGLALASLRWAWRRGDRMWRRLAGWLIVIPPLLYLPFGLQRRLIEAWQIPLSILAAVTLARVVLPAMRRSRFVHWLTRFPRYTSGGMQRLALSGLLLWATPTFGLLLLDQSLRAATRQAPMFRDGGEVAALEWLSTRTTYADVVLSAYDTGNVAPARAAARVFVGHGPETIHLDEKLPLVKRFYSAATDDAWREAFLRKWGIDIVFVGPFERALGTADLRGKPYLILEYDTGDYQVYRVTSDK